MTDTAESDLLLRAQAGDYDAFEALYDRLAGPVRRFVRRLTGGDDDDTEDIVQMTFIALYRHLGEVAPPHMLRPYVFRIARNRCYDRLRSLGRYDPESLDDEAVEMRVSFAHDGPRATDDVVHWLLLGLQVREAIDQLPELQRQTLILYAEEDMTYEEIAVAMDTNIGTVKSRIFHARQGLRRRLPAAALAAIEDDVYESEAAQAAQEQA